MRRKLGRAFELPHEMTRAQIHLPREGIDRQVLITRDRDFLDERWYPRSLRRAIRRVHRQSFVAGRKPFFSATLQPLNLLQFELA
jgi:hypothetical protein